jgi:hypothetical protein
LQHYQSTTGLDESVYDIALDSAGNAFVTGRQTNGAEGDDIMTMKLAAADGGILWMVHVGGSARQADRGWAVTVGPDGNPVVTGVESTVADPAYFCTVKYRSSDGGEIWRREIPGAINYVERRAGWLAVCDNGDVLMASRTWTGSAGYDVVLHRYAAADGESVWEREYDSPASQGDDPTDMVRDAAGDVLVAGVSAGDYMVLKFDEADGELVWSSGYDGPAGGYDEAAAVIEGPGGEVLVTGYSRRSETGWDAVTVGFDPFDGEEVWEAAFDAGDAAGDEGKALAASPFGDLYLVGYGSLFATGSDILAVRYRLESATGIAERPASAPAPAGLLRFTASPNPFVARIAFTLELADAAQARVAVYDITGRLAGLLHEGVLSRGAHVFRWDGRDAGGRKLAPGIYFVRVETAGGSAARKVVLSR